MKNQHLIIMGVLLLLAIGTFFYFRNKKAKSASFNTSPAVSSIPAEVLRENPADWIGESLTVGGVKYVVVNGQWQRA